MQLAPNRPDETETLRALAALQVLDTAPDPEFDSLAQAAALACGVPIALVSLVDADRQWFKANLGLAGVTETPREQAFCAHAVLGPDLLEVPDATQDERFANNPLVVGEPRIRFYAGAPLCLREGHRIGTLCVIDRQPRRLTEAQRGLLRQLALVAASTLEGRRALLAERGLLADAARAALVLHHSADAIVGIDGTGLIVRWNPAAEHLLGYPRSAVQGWTLDALWPPEQRPTEAARLAQLRATGALTCDSVLLHRDGGTISVAATFVAERSATGEWLGATAFFRDSRERERARADLIASQDRLRRLYESTPALLHAIDEDGRLTMVSDAWLARLGYTRAEVIGRRSTEFLTEASRQFVVGTGIPTLMRSGRQDNLELQFVARDGDIVDVLLSAVVRRDESDGSQRIHAGLQDVTLRRRAERELERERQRLLNIIEGTHAGIWEWHVPTGELRLNERSAAILGSSVAALGTRTIALRSERTHPDDLPRVAAEMRRHLAGETEHYEVESRVRHADGRWIWILDRGRLMTRTADGKPEWMFGIHQDIGPRKAQEEALRRSEAFLDRTGRAAGVGGWELEVASGQVTWSDETRRMHGVAPDYQPTLASAIEFYAPEARPAIQSAVTAALEVGGPWDLELPLIRSDGTRIWARAVGMAERVGGRTVRLSGAFQDITARKLLERRLVEQEKFLRQVLDSVPALIAHIGPDRRYTLVNRAFVEWTRRPLAELVGADMATSFGTEAASQSAPFLEQAFGGEAASFELALRRAGELCHLQVSYMPEHDEAGSVAGVYAMKVDVTAQRRADEALAAKSQALARSNEDLERFAYVASHDLQEPLRMVTSYGQLLERRHAALPDQAREYLHFMVDGGQRAQTLIRDLLSLARLDSHAQSRQAVPLEAVLAQVMGQLQLRVQETGAVVTHDLLPSVKADATQMGQLLLNLVGNALKFRSAVPPQVHVGAERDNGIGIDQKFFERVFVMFQRLHLRSEHEGTGIGLAICKKIVEGHGGRIGVASTPGQGSTFWFTLPDSPEAQP
jgi:PAS domain S-box-containing protein